MSRIAYKFLKHPDEMVDGEKVSVPPQMRTILKTLETLCDGEKFIDRDALVKELEKPDGDKPNKLNARQACERVVAFYQKRMVTDGLIEMQKTAAPKKEGKASGKTAAPKGKAKVPAGETSEEAAEAMSV